MRRTFSSTEKFLMKGLPLQSNLNRETFFLLVSPAEMQGADEPGANGDSAHMFGGCRNLRMRGGTNISRASYIWSLLHFLLLQCTFFAQIKIHEDHRGILRVSMTNDL